LLEVAGGIRAFYDIDTPVTVASLDRGACAYVSAELVPRFDLYLSFTGGPLLARIEREYGARRTCPFHCLVDEEAYRPLDVAPGSAAARAPACSPSTRRVGESRSSSSSCATSERWRLKGPSQNSLVAPGGCKPPRCCVPISSG